MKQNYFRLIFGTYLLYHFSTILLYSNEIFGRDYMINDWDLLQTRVFPNILFFISPFTLVSVLMLLSFFFAMEYYHKECAILLWYGWACLLNANPFISNPGLPYVGMLLLVAALRDNTKNMYFCIWFVMALSYTVSGIHKLQCPSWIDGTALYHILNSPLARDNFLRSVILGLPDYVIKLSTWAALGMEITFLPLGMFYHTRWIYWWGFMIFHLSVILLINFTDLTLGVLMIHFYTFDESFLFR